MKGFVEGLVRGEMLAGEVAVQCLSEALGVERSSADWQQRFLELLEMVHVLGLLADVVAEVAEVEQLAEVAEVEQLISCSTCGHVHADAYGLNGCIACHCGHPTDCPCGCQELAEVAEVEQLAVSHRGRHEASGFHRVAQIDVDVRRLLYPSTNHRRPSRRGECEEFERPCPFVGCRHHLFADVSDVGSIKEVWPDREPWDVPETCSLDVADRGGLTLDQVGIALNVTRERARQIEKVALRKLGTQQSLIVLREVLRG